MRKLFCLFSLFAIYLSASAASEWLYYKHYPWVYDNVSKDWLYLRGSSNGEIYSYRSSTQKWEVFEVQEGEKTWNEQYEEWIQNPEPYGGLEVLQWIKDAKESRATELAISFKNISDLSPLTALTNLTRLDLSMNNITDLTPLAGLTNLTIVELYYNYNLSDLSPLARLTNLTTLTLSNNNITDITPLAGLTNLERVLLDRNNISESQKAMLEEALPNTEIIW